MRCAQRLKRVCDIQIGQFPHSGGQLKSITTIEQRAVILRVLTHVRWAPAAFAHRQNR